MDADVYSLNIDGPTSIGRPMIAHLNHPSRNWLTIVLLAAFGVVLMAAVISLVLQQLPFHETDEFKPTNFGLGNNSTVIQPTMKSTVTGQQDQMVNRPGGYLRKSNLGLTNSYSFVTTTSSTTNGSSTITALFKIAPSLTPDPCAQPLLRGVCAGKFIRYHFDAGRRRCSKFIYSGCGGNSNRFLSALECREICDFQHSYFGEPISDSPCFDAFDRRRSAPCENRLWTQRFYYDHDQRQCREFWHDVSCNSTTALATQRRPSRNVFLRLDICRRTCETTTNPSRNGSAVVGVTQASLANVTTSQSWLPRNYFRRPTTASRLIDPTPYSSMASASLKTRVEPYDDNVHEVLAIGKMLARQRSPNSTAVRRPKFYKTPVADVCLDTKPNKFYTLSNTSFVSRVPAWRLRYYYDSTTCRCRSFWHDASSSCVNVGQLRSRNDFDDLMKCLWLCQGGQTSGEAEQGSCVDDFDEALRTDCRGGKFIRRFYFDRHRKQCTAFLYGGCRPPSGSRNIFHTYEHCLNACESPTRFMQKSCRVPLSDVYRTTCRGASLSQYFYFDANAKACRMFWYSNCRPTPAVDGAENIFATMETCQWLCERNRYRSTPASCLDESDELLSVRLCSLTWRRMWRFERADGRCREFWHGGCASTSQNVFVSRELCNNLCELPVLLAAGPEKSAVAEQENCQNEKSETDVLFRLIGERRCIEDVAVGDCSHAFPAYFYNKWTRECEPFAYSGCGGNANRFLTLAQCRNACAGVSRLSAKETDCIQPLDTGRSNGTDDCDSAGASFRFRYSMEYGVCARFWYHGCGGSANRFPTFGACERQCRHRQLVDALQAPFGALTRRAELAACFLTADNSTKDDNNCTVDNSPDETVDLLLTAESGAVPNRRRANSVERWLFDETTGQCNLSLNSSCSANETPGFLSKQDCEATCNALYTPKSRNCVHPPEWGPCNQLRHVWFYNASSGGCTLFLYGGCGGNANRFASRHDCEAECVPDIEENLCLDELDRGRWCEQMSNRYYYHRQSNTCRGFHYTGCGRSRNNFRRVEDCREQCVSSSMIDGNTIATIGNHTNSSAKAQPLSQGAPDDLPVPVDIRRHEYLDATTRPYLKFEDIWLIGDECAAFRYNVSGAHSRLTAYFCLVEDGGGCQVETLLNTNGDERCFVVRPARRSGRHRHSWFFTVDQPTGDKSSNKSIDKSTAAVLLLNAKDCDNLC